MIIIIIRGFLNCIKIFSSSFSFFRNFFLIGGFNQCHYYFLFLEIKKIFEFEFQKKNGKDEKR